MLEQTATLDDRHFFRLEGGTLHPTPRCVSPWDVRALHGRVLNGLIAYEVESAYADSAFQPVRLTVDMFRVAPMVPLQVTTRLIRDGNRIRVVDASILTAAPTADGIDAGTEIARGSVVFLRRSEQPPGEIWSPPPWSVPEPESVPLADPATLPRAPQWEVRRIRGDMRTAGPKEAWTRETNQLVAGVEPSGFVRAAQVADYASPLANSGTDGLHFVNADTTLYLHRDPEGEWIGVELAAHHSSAGVAIAECVLHDRDGAFGRSSVCAVANRRR